MTLREKIGRLNQTSQARTPEQQKSMKICAENGGGIVSVSGGVFITGTLFMRFYVGFRIDANATQCPRIYILIIVSLR